ncbi:uncharacterized protein E0L32_007846 [Thyridium curvatum]|uniref:Uncharacterized protein n=1 Tax=Thyridium curvatum TaxID=1093900 RepID=A0A507AVB4_9PEZI|nr:uncharacterized protein E0L32_007846 [Thyridium curvatum]TPX11427.1 hypothetical protein E0L32_007846 [Thyridium curvatum]
MAPQTDNSFSTFYGSSSQGESHQARQYGDGQGKATVVERRNHNGDSVVVINHQKPDPESGAAHPPYTGMKKVQHK